MLWGMLLSKTIKFVSLCVIKTEVTSIIEQVNQIMEVMVPVRLGQVHGCLQAPRHPLCGLQLVISYRFFVLARQDIVMGPCDQFLIGTLPKSEGWPPLAISEIWHQPAVV